ncbi:hypothetical protein PR048_019051 [Dryococelus australis]|uniref:Integrase catalytic domain-containing protein n=1 Tax=Dryococelus australis TaxID=614101 RepID=A0ABQ9H2E3_9NEOP|nr:hypothetical protein PR048_019051 [Dryococelus australis]
MAADINNQSAHVHLKEADKASASLDKRGEDRLLPLHHLLPPWKIPVSTLSFEHHVQLTFTVVMRVSAALKQKDCWEAVEPGYNGADIKDLSVEKRRKNYKALEFINLGGSEASEIFEGIHTNYGLLHMIMIVKEVVNTTKIDYVSMHEHMSKIHNLNRKRIKRGLHFTDKSLVMFYLMGLPLEKFDGLVRAMEKDEDNLTPAVVKVKLLFEEKRIRRDKDQKANMEGAKAMAVKQLLNRSPGKIMLQKIEDQKQRPRYGEQGYQLGNAQTVQYNFNALCTSTIKMPDCKNCWLLDTAASYHMTPNRDIMRNFNSEVHGEVEVANGQMAKIKHVRMVTIKVKDKHIGWTIELSDVFCVPDLCNNLISGKRMDVKGMEVRIIHGCVTVLDDNIEIFKALSGSEHNVYIVECETYIAAQEKVCATANSTVTSEAWHKKFGHVQVLPHVSGLQEVSSERCDVCLEGKMKRQKFQNSSSRALEPLNLVHSDVVGKISPASLEGAEYLVKFVDDCSRHTHAAVVKNKSDTFNEFCKFQSSVEKLQEIKLKVLQTDNGGEFINTEFKKHLGDSGVLHRLTTPYTLQQNGRTE